MSFFKSLFGGKKKSEVATDNKMPVTSATLKVLKIKRLIKDAVKIEFEIPAELKDKFTFVAGQYVNLDVVIDGEKVRRSYSICSGEDEGLAVGVKKIEDGYVSAFLNDRLKEGDEMEVSFPMGNFTLPEKEDGTFVAIAAGSGITPILSMAKAIDKSENREMRLFYGNRTDQTIMFENDLSELEGNKVKVTHVFSDQEKEGFLHGMLTEDVLMNIFRSDLSLLRAKGFYVCGPEQVVMNVIKVLDTFGVAENKINYELFTTPVEMVGNKTAEPAEKFEGVAKVTVKLGGEEETFDLAAKGDTILGEAESHGMDAPYSCRGGICTSCKAKVTEGSVTMDKNFALTDEEVEQGFTLTCQAHPNSPVVKIDYDI